eukprot:jgi/Tetstr1/459457/TSEL_004825.t1
MQHYLSAINTFLRHTGREDAPATGPNIGDMKLAFQIRQLKTSEELRCARLPCDVTTDILDELATLPMATPGYCTILREGTAVCSTFMFYSRALLRRFIAYRDAAFRAAPSAKQPRRFWALPGDRATYPAPYVERLHPRRHGGRAREGESVV